MVVFPKGDHHIGEKVMVKITGSTSATLLGELCHTDLTDHTDYYNDEGVFERVEEVCAEV